MDPKTISVGAIFGAVAWEVVRQLLAIFAKRTQDARDSKRKMLREDIECIARLVCEILEASVGYYGTVFGTEKADDLSRQIKAKSKTVGMKLSAMNFQLAASSADNFDVHLWTSFKAATTKHLDVTRAATWHQDDPRINEIYKTATHMHSSLNRVRYANV